MKTEVLDNNFTGGTVVIENNRPVPKKNYYSGLLSIGDAIDGYSIVSQLNTNSGEAEIYICEKDNRHFILKYYYNNKPDFEIISKLKTFKNPNIIELHQTGTYNNRFYSVMEYAQGGSLDEKDSYGNYKYLPMSEEKAFQTVKEVINAFNALHDAGLIHRDIKPGNLFYKNKDASHILIGDFGICASFDKDEGMSKHITQSQARTEGFSAPEAYSGVIGPELDYYSLGITLWILLSGKEPFLSDDGKAMFPGQIMLDTIQGKVPDMLLAKNSGLSQRMQSLIRGLLTVRHDKRWNYDMVTRFLNGENIPVYQEVYDLPSFQIGAKNCTSFKQIAEALLEDKENSKKIVYGGQLTKYLIKIDRELTEKIDNIIEKYSADNNLDDGVTLIAYLLCPNLGFKLSDSVSIYSLQDFVSILDSKPYLILDYLTEEKKGFYTFLSAIGLTDISEEIRNIIKNSKSELMIRKKILIALNGNIIKPFKDGVNDNLELKNIEQLSRLPDYLKRRILILVNANNQKMRSWIENLTGCNLGTWISSSEKSQDEEGVKTFTERWDAFYSFITKKGIVAYSKYFATVNGVNCTGLKNADNEIVLEAIWQDCLEQGFDERFIVQKNNKWGVIDSHGKEIVRFEYEQIKPLSYNNSIFYKVIKNSGSTVLDAEGNILCSTKDESLCIINNPVSTTLYFYDSKSIYEYTEKKCVKKAHYDNGENIIGKTDGNSDFFWIQKQNEVVLWNPKTGKNSKTSFKKLYENQNYDYPFVLVKSADGYGIQSVDNSRTILECVYEKIKVSADNKYVIISSFGNYGAYQINTDGSLGSFIQIKLPEDTAYIYELENADSEFTTSLNFVDSEGLWSYALENHAKNKRTALLKDELDLMLKKMPFVTLNKLLLALKKDNMYMVHNYITEKAGHFYYENGKNEEAFRCFVRINQSHTDGLEKEFGDYQCLAGLCLLGLKGDEFKDALYFISNGLENLRNPDSSYKVGLVTCYITLQRFDLADKYCDKFLKTDESNHELHAFKALCLARELKLEDAVVETTKAISLHERKDYYEQRAMLYEALAAQGAPDLKRLAEEDRRKAKLL